jgi:N-acetylglucosaminyldiphosphoundecaprenol N-acetyl-beta-D-mannosaminyltransferase
MQRMEKQKGRVFFMGSSEKVLNLIEDRLSNQFPNITAGFFSPPYKAEFDVTDNQKILNEVNSFRPDVLFVGMTAPKQEKWVQEHKDKLDADVICSIGAVFDFYAGTVKRSGKIWIKIGLEWLPRLFREPRRLFTRNFVSTPLFLLDILLGKIGLKKWETP